MLRSPLSAFALCLGLVPVLSPLPALAQSAPKVCADLELEVQIVAVGRDRQTVILRVKNLGPGPFDGRRGEQWVEHVVMVGGKEVDRKRNPIGSLQPGATRDFTFARFEADGDFEIWAMITYAEGLAKDQNPANDDCNAANNGGVRAFVF
jgi:hypothetical protein